MLGYLIFWEEVVQHIGQLTLKVIIIGGNYNIRASPIVKKELVNQ